MNNFYIYHIIFTTRLCLFQNNSHRLIKDLPITNTEIQMIMALPAPPRLWAETVAMQPSPPPIRVPITRFTPLPSVAPACQSN